eukprot:4776283-Pleurochrysis_carterae.AAC.5
MAASSSIACCLARRSAASAVSAAKARASASLTRSSSDARGRRDRSSDRATGDVAECGGGGDGADAGAALGAADGAVDGAASPKQGDKGNAPASIGEHEGDACVKDDSGCGDRRASIASHWESRRPLQDTSQETEVRNTARPS